MCICMSLLACVFITCVQVPTEAQKMSSDTLELELQAVVSLPVWGVGTKPISPVSEVIIMAALFPKVLPLIRRNLTV